MHVVCNPGMFWASFAALSAASFPIMPTWLGTLHRVIFRCLLWSLERTVWIDWTRGCLGFCWDIACMDDWESVKIVHLRLIEFSIIDKAFSIACSSAVKIEASFGSVPRARFK